MRSPTPPLNLGTTPVAPTPGHPTFLRSRVNLALYYGKSRVVRDFGCKDEKYE
jgi:hypothetical protein